MGLEPISPHEDSACISVNTLLLLKLMTEQFDSRQQAHPVRALTCVIKDGRFNGAVFEIGIS